MNKVITLKVSEETIDAFIKDVLKQSLDMVKEDIKIIKKMKNPRLYQKEDLANDVILYDALERVYEYFGGNLRR